MYKPTVEILQGGACLLYMQYKPISLPPEDPQFLSTREFDVEEICRMFQVPPHLVQDLKRSTFNNTEHQGIAFVQYSLMLILCHFHFTFHFFVIELLRNVLNTLAILSGILVYIKCP